MASIYPDEGLDAMIGVFPRALTPAPSLYLGLFTSQSATTVPSRAMVLAIESGITEANGANYARQAVAGWGAPTTDGSGRTVTADQVTFPAAGSGGWGTTNGFFLATAPSGGVCIYAANFDDETATAVNAGDIIKITPSMTFGQG